MSLAHSKCNSICQVFPSRGHKLRISNWFSTPTPIQQMAIGFLTQASTFASDIATFTSVDIEDGDYVMILTNYAAGATDPPLTDSQAADGVLGQPDFDSRAQTMGASPPPGSTAPPT